MTTIKRSDAADDDVVFTSTSNPDLAGHCILWSAGFCDLYGSESADVATAIADAIVRHGQKASLTGSSAGTFRTTPAGEIKDVIFVYDVVKGYIYLYLWDEADPWQHMALTNGEVDLLIDFFVEDKSPSELAH
jgi:hypothetical protein